MMASEGLVVCSKDVLPEYSFLHSISTDDLSDQMTEAYSVATRANALLEDLNMEIFEYEGKASEMFKVSDRQASVKSLASKATLRSSSASAA